MKTILLLPLLFFPINDVIVEDINSGFFFIEESQIEKYNKDTENIVKNYYKTNQQELIFTPEKYVF